MLITKNNDLKGLPIDVKDRIQFLLNNVDYMPIYIANIDLNKAGFINKYSEGYVEVFILYNNESGAHYFFRDEETFLQNSVDRLKNDILQSFNSESYTFPFYVCTKDFKIFLLKEKDTMNTKMLGFSGRKFRFCDARTGEIIESCNVWHCGDVPEKRRDEFNEFTVFDILS